MGHGRPGGNRRETATESVVRIARGIRSPVEWSQEKPEFASGIGGATQPIGLFFVPVGLAGTTAIIRFTVVEQDVPPLLPVGIMRKLQARLILNDDGDKVISRVQALEARSIGTTTSRTMRLRFKEASDFKPNVSVKDKRAFHCVQDGAAELGRSVA